jgi:predicted helicase
MRNIEIRKIEGENVFGSQTRLGVCVIFLVKNSKAQSKKAQIYYAEIGDGLKAKEKLRKLKNIVASTNEHVIWQPIIPNERYDWLNQRNLNFHNYPELRKAIFNVFSNGILTGKDYILYDFAGGVLLKKVQRYFVIEDLHKHIKIAFYRPFVPMWVCYHPKLLKAIYKTAIIDTNTP